VFFSMNQSSELMIQPYIAFDNPTNSSVVSPAADFHWRSSPAETRANSRTDETIHTVSSRCPRDRNCTFLANELS